MPNWVCNHLIIHGENACDVMRSLLIKNEASECGYDLDFNKILPMPEDLNIISGTITTNCARLYVNAMLEDCDAYIKYAKLFVNAFSGNLFITETARTQLMKDALQYKDHANDKPLFSNEAEVYAYGKRALDNYSKYGAKDWYDWSVNNWGTKWNACNTIIHDPNDADIYFDTAWSPVPMLIEKLAKQHPECSFEYKYAEEQAGIYAGQYYFENGIAVSGGPFRECSKEAYEMFFSLWGMEDEFKFNPKTNTYEPIDEEVM